MNLNELFEQIKKIFWIETKGKNNGKKLNMHLLILLFVGVLLMIFSSIFDFTRDVPSVEPSEDKEELTLNSEQIGEEPLISELTEVLNQIKGVSDVSIFLSMDSGSEFEYARNLEQSQRDTQEKDNQGGVREMIEEDKNINYVVIRDAQGKERPLLIKETKPRVRGALVVARGAENLIIKESIIEALQSSLGLPSHRITVLPK